MARYSVIGYEEFPALHLLPADDDQGVDLPPEMYARWLAARAALDTVQRDVVAHLRDSGGRGAIPEELWESQDRSGLERPAGTPSDDAGPSGPEGDGVRQYGQLSARL